MQRKFRTLYSDQAPENWQRLWLNFLFKRRRYLSRDLLLYPALDALAHSVHPVASVYPLGFSSLRQAEVHKLDNTAFQSLLLVFGKLSFVCRYLTYCSNRKFAANKVKAKIWVKFFANLI